MLVLMCVSLFLLMVRIVYPYFMDPSDIVLHNLTFAPHDTLTGQDSTPGKKINANTATAGELVSAGFPEKTAQTLIKYRKHHPFREKKDLLKVYGVTEKLYSKVSGNIFVEAPTERNRPEYAAKPQVYKRQTKEVVELNSADSVQLESVSGIGPVYARRIIKYRDLLGGFVVAEQLKEVYGLTAESYERIRPGVRVDPSLIRKINVNNDDFKTVNRHPYVSYELTKTIFNARRRNPLTAESLQATVNSDSLWQRLQPYVTY